MNLNSPAFKAFVADFLVTLAATLAALQFAPTSIQTVIDGYMVVAFAVLKSGVQAAYKAGLKWATS